MRLRIAAAVLATAALVVAAAAPSSAASPTADLDHSLAAIFAASGSTGMSVRVDVAGSGTVFTHTSARTLTPASTEKLVTAYTALRVLGPSRRFVTRIGATAAPDPHGVIHGSLVVSAGGDPTLTTTGGLAVLAKTLHDQGIRTVTGGILLDDTLLSKTRRAAGWKSSWVPTEVGPLSAFAVNGDSWRYDAGYLANPDIGNLQALQSVLRRYGITVQGHFNVGRPSATPRPLASYQSSPVSAIVRVMLKDSVNFDAEMLLEDVGAARGSGSPAGGVAVVRSVARTLGLDLGGNIEDGSGLSLLDRESADGEVRWLEAVARDRVLGPLVYGDLPIGCVDGTLARRPLLCGMPRTVHAKTGTLDGMRALSGWVLDAAGHQVTFAFLVGGPPSSATRGKTAIDKAVRAVAASHL